jgi:2'-5' RNA ligase
MKNNIFLAAIPSYDNCLGLTQKLLNCEAKRSPLVRVNWTHIDDLHVTLGYIERVDSADLRSIVVGFSSISQFTPLMANAEEIRIYGNAIVMRLEPLHRFLTIHKKMNQKLVEVSENRYHFFEKRHYDPHLTLGRVRNWQVLNPQHKEQFLNLIKEQFQGQSFLIQQAALMYSLGENKVPTYGTIHKYNLKR